MRTGSFKDPAFNASVEAGSIWVASCDDEKYCEHFEYELLETTEKTYAVFGSCMGHWECARPNHEKPNLAYFGLDCISGLEIAWNRLLACRSLRGGQLVLS